MGMIFTAPIAEDRAFRLGREYGEETTVAPPTEGEIYQAAINAGVMGKHYDMFCQGARAAWREKRHAQ